MNLCSVIKAWLNTSQRCQVVMDWSVTVKRSFTSYFVSTVHHQITVLFTQEVTVRLYIAMSKRFKIICVHTCTHAHTHARTHTPHSIMISLSCHQQTFTACCETGLKSQNISSQPCFRHNVQGTSVSTNKNKMYK